MKTSYPISMQLHQDADYLMLFCNDSRKERREVIREMAAWKSEQQNG